MENVEKKYKQNLQHSSTENVFSKTDNGDQTQFQIILLKLRVCSEEMQ